MRHWRLPLALATIAVLSGCSDNTRHQNSAHPNYGAAEYKQDLDQCRSQNSKVVVTQGYDAGSKVEVDEAKAQACMTGRGWQTTGR